MWRENQPDMMDGSKVCMGNQSLIIFCYTADLTSPISFCGNPSAAVLTRLGRWSRHGDRRLVSGGRPFLEARRHAAPLRAPISMLSHATSTSTSASFAASGARAPRARAGRVVASIPSRRRQLIRPRTGRLPVASARRDASRGPHPPRAYAPAKPVSDAFDAPSPDPPLLIFVNGKSGGRRGEELKALLAQRPDLNALDVVDIGRRGPREALERYAGKVPDLRVLVCGGDGTVAWVLQALEDLAEVRREPPRDTRSSPRPGFVNERETRLRNHARAGRGPHPPGSVSVSPSRPRRSPAAVRLPSLVP